jgi:DNA-directed RNA polymerase subunit alpha
MTELEYLEMKKKVDRYEYNQHRKMMKKMTRFEVIEDLDISVRLYNVLKRCEIHTIQELKEYNFVNLLRIRGCGKKCFNEIEQLFEDKGWVLIYNVFYSDCIV